jgi:hypothetical protein
VTVRNGLTLAYTVALINTLLALLIAFGATVTNEQQAAIMAFVNAAVLLSARVLHLPERTPSGGTIQVNHVPVLSTKEPVAVRSVSEVPAVVPVVEAEPAVET